MKCPVCGFPDSKVIDSRPASEGNSIRRRRECLSCQKRFTTFEMVETVQTIVIKKDGSKELFDRNKLLSGLLKACQKRPVNAEEIVSEIEGARDLVRASFVVADKLTYLARGGRCTAVTALMANALKLHPEIVVRDGKMGVGRKYRGKTSVAVSAYVDGLMPALQRADTRRVFITHSGCEDEVIEAVRQRLTELGRFEEILITRAGGVISSHCGPNTLGVLFYEQK